MIMNIVPPVSPKVFKVLQNVNIKELSRCSTKELRPILPCLVRMSLISPLDVHDVTRECAEDKKRILTLLSGIEIVNSLVALLSIDFHALEVDVKKEQQLRQKQGTSQGDSVLIQSLVNGLALEFERSDSTRRLRLVLSEILYIHSQIQEQSRGVLAAQAAGQSSQGPEHFLKQSDLLDNTVYLDEVCDVVCIALAELPGLLSITDLAETFLHVSNGPRIICTIVANSPDCFREVCINLITNGERQEEESIGGRIRIQALNMLCQMNPTEALNVRAKCVELCRMPALAITLSLDHISEGDWDQLMDVDQDLDQPSTLSWQGHPNDLPHQDRGDMVAFISGLLLGSDQQIRTWFALFVRNGQKRKGESHAALQLLRRDLLRRLDAINAEASGDGLVADALVVQASSLLRLYCALRGIAGIKFQDEEVSSLMQLLTWHPTPSMAGVRFVSLGLCVLIACPSLITTAEHEKKAVEWVQWLVHEEAYFKNASGVTASFGEMLLLMAIHFHSNQLSAIIDLVSATLGMKVVSRSNNINKIKHLFTQEVFTEQVVTSHAVKVPVTPSLNATMQGFLPIHCIHQLLKSRAFTKHRVPIKDWIYSQIVCSEPPLHPVLAPLVEVYVNSMLVFSNKAPMETTNQPITEDDIRKVFQHCFVGEQFDSKSQISVNGAIQVTKPPSLTAQLLLLYYLVLYEDVRLSNSYAHAQADITPRRYSTEFMAKLPIKYLLQQAQKDPNSFAGLFPPLLNLLATHFPHLALVDDWLDESSTVDVSPATSESVPLSADYIDRVFQQQHSDPAQCVRVLKRLLAIPATDVWPYADTLINHFRTVLSDKTPRHIQELYRQVWLRLNSVLPRSLWVKTIRGMMQSTDPLYHRAICLTQENLTTDPLQVLRCDMRVFRCASLLLIALRVLQASLAASRSQLSRHMQDRPLVQPIGQLTCENDREELRVALVATQESAAVQVLLEACLPSEEDEEIPGQKWSLREVRSVICSYLHQVFIADISLAKLVHFQGYSRSLLAVTVPSVPSMHICLDFIPELLTQPDLDKQMFAVDLVSHLAVQYALPKSLSVARLAINTLSTLLGVLPSSSRVRLFGQSLPALVRICHAFPPLIEDVVSLLLQLGRVCMSVASLDAGASAALVSCQAGVKDTWNFDSNDRQILSNEHLCLKVQQAFTQILTRAVLYTTVY